MGAFVVLPTCIPVFMLVFQHYAQQQVDRLALQSAQEAVTAEERASMQRFHAYFDHSIVGLAITSLEKGWLEVNDALCATLGYSRAELTNLSWTELTYSDDLALDLVQFNRMLAGEIDSYAMDKRFVHKDGHLVHTRLAVSNVRKADGSVDYVVAMVEDISEQKIASLALERREKQLRFVLAGSALGFWDWDIVSGSVDRNERWAEMLGYSHEEIEHTTRQWTDFIHPEDRERAWNSINAVLEGGSAIHRLEYRMLHKDGSVRWVLDQASVMQRDPDGKPMRMCGTHTDITERKQVEFELLRHRHHLQELVEAQTRDLVVAKNAAEAANRAKSAFLANMSHELRTPMNGVMGMLELAKRRMTDPQGLDQLGKAKHAAERLLGVLNDILDLSKIEAERMVLEDAPLQLRDSVNGVAGTLGNEAARKGLTLQIDLPADLAERTLKGDSLRLGQILLNLLGNAIKFTEQGGVSLKVRALGETREVLQVRFEVSDTGVGIDLEARGRLFQSFEQADNSMTRRYGGTGLGLAICKSLGQLMGGEIGVDSVPGEGSMFWFVVPLKKRESGLPQPETSCPDCSVEQHLRGQYAGLRVLLVEDEPITQEVARNLLEEVGLSVDTAENGRQALTLANCNEYALILMDMQMPVMNGIDAAGAIRADSLNRETPILAMTANAFDEDRRHCLDVGMNDHIAKPVDPEKLYETLLQWLEVGARKATA
ncbi:PAS domain S-box protein [Dechloromonas sp. ARDL1]|uniref:PAS domain S-box protein n=1 Tax=Dechloromonas sp. ARDL1 TaxID=3322121 RepID=UPI003DA76D77